MGKTRTPLNILVLKGVPKSIHEHFQSNGHNSRYDPEQVRNGWLEDYDLILGPNCRTYQEAFETDYGRDLLDQLIKLKQKEKKDVQG